MGAPEGSDLTMCHMCTGRPMLAPAFTSASVSWKAGSAAEESVPPDVG